MITDHSSAGFEFLLQDRPLVRIHRPELLRLANIHPDYVALLASASQSVLTADEAIDAVERGLADPASRSATRRAVANELFYRAGGATARSVTQMYEAISLDPLRSEAPAHEEVTCPSSL
jgi:CDP-glycerol glycerophosphotransferase (TagB/SpsB family)